MMPYDIPVLCHKLHVCIMISKFIQRVNGCADTLALAHKLNGTRKKINGLG